MSHSPKNHQAPLVNQSAPRNYPSAPPPPPLSEIEEKILLIRNTLADIENNLDHHESRLTPIRIPEPCAKGECGASPQAVLSPIGDQLYDLSCRAGRINDRIINLGKNLAI